MSEKLDRVIDINEVMSMIPHRYPILLVDKVKDIVLDKSCVGIKNVTVNEPHFQGHFPSKPIMPGVLIVEAMAQASACLVVETLGEEAKGKLVYFMTIDKTRFRNPVIPGDVLELHIEKVRQRGPVWKFTGQGIVDGKVCAEAEFSAMIIDE